MGKNCPSPNESDITLNLALSEPEIKGKARVGEGKPVAKREASGLSA